MKKKSVHSLTTAQTEPNTRGNIMAKCDKCGQEMQRCSREFEEGSIVWYECINKDCLEYGKWQDGKKNLLDKIIDKIIG